MLSNTTLIGPDSRFKYQKDGVGRQLIKLILSHNFQENSARRSGPRKFVWLGAS